ELSWTPLGALGRNSEELYNPVVSRGEEKKVDESGQKEAEVIMGKLQNIRIPEFSIRPPSTLADAVQLFAELSKAYDKPDLLPEDKGVSFVLNMGSNPAQAAAPAEEDAFASDDGASSAGLPPIQSISMTFVTIKEALDMVCEVTGAKYVIKGKTVMIVPASYVAGKMETRSYNVTGIFDDKVSQVSSELGSGSGGGSGWDMDSSASSSDSGAAGDTKKLFMDLGVPFEGNASLVYLKSIGKIRVTNTPENLAIFERVLEELNVTPFQIEVEARFVEVSQTDLNSLGFEWQLNSDIVGTVGSGIDWASSHITGNANGGTAAGGIGAGGNHVFRPSAKSGTGDSNVAMHGGSFNNGMRFLGDGSTYANRINLAGSSIAPDDTFASFSAVFGRVDMTMILHMLAQRSDTDMLSSPKVVARSGMEAMMKVVTQWIYPTEFDVTELEEADTTYDNNNTSVTGGGINVQAPPVKFAVEPQSFESQDVGVSLQVMPEVSQEGQMINLSVNPKVVEYLGDFDYGMQVPYIQYTMTGGIVTGAEVQYYQVSMPQPKFHIREVSTYLSVYNGATVVMGGLITETRKSFEDKIPFLGDLPFIGFLFRSTGEYSEKRNLLIFLTARLVDPAGRPLKTATDGRTGTSALDKGTAETMSSTAK
ncbi:MAG: type II secretion system protein GspD, partial [Candidatus Spyradenecus sp.]